MALSARLQAVLDALPLEPGMRVLEVGAGPGALARAIADRIGHGGVVAACASTVVVALLGTTG